MENARHPQTHMPWNKGKLVGQKAPLKPEDVLSIRVRLSMDSHARDLALFDSDIDSMRRGCDFVRAHTYATFPGPTDVA
jgi:hypothetical protein